MIPILLSIIQFDFGFSWNFTLTDAQEQPVNLTGATAILFDCQLNSDPTVQFSNAMAVVSPVVGTCKYVVQQNDFIVAGTYTAQIKVQYGVGEIVSFAGITVQVDPKVPQA